MAGIVCNSAALWLLKRAELRVLTGTCDSALPFTRGRFCRRARGRVGLVKKEDDAASGFWGALVDRLFLSGLDAVLLAGEGLRVRFFLRQESLLAVWKRWADL